MCGMAQQSSLTFFENANSQPDFTVVLRGYDRVAVWVRRGRERLTTTLRRAPCLSPTSLAGEGQGEAIALDRRGGQPWRGGGS